MQGWSFHVVVLQSFLLSFQNAILDLSTFMSFGELKGQEYEFHISKIIKNNVIHMKYSQHA